MALLRILIVPPFQQYGETLLALIDAPIKLWCEIICPPVGHPFSRVGVKTIVSIEAADLRRIARTPDAERTDAKLHPGLRRLDGFVSAFDEIIHVVASPVVAAEAGFSAGLLPA